MKAIFYTGLPKPSLLDIAIPIKISCDGWLICSSVNYISLPADKYEKFPTMQKSYKAQLIVHPEF